jgi:hypothetical protein
MRQRTQDSSTIGWLSYGHRRYYSQNPRILLGAKVSSGTVLSRTGRLGEIMLNGIIRPYDELDSS